MAIYHLHVKNISRGKGQSAIASASYRRAARLFNEREERFYDYTSKCGVIHSEITASENAPTWVKQLIELHLNDKSAAAEKLWNGVEFSEKRADSRLAKEIEFALPIELSEQQNINLAREYIHDQFALRGMIADWSVHWDEGNPHVHVMLTTRQLTEAGFGYKAREWNNDNLVVEWREKWAEYANFHLRLNQHSVRIDHRSYEEQGIDLIPSVHVGKAVTDMGRRGIATQIMKEANQVRYENLSRIAANPDILLKKISVQHDSFTTTQLGQELGRYINDKGGFSYRQQAVLAAAVLQKLNNEDAEEKGKGEKRSEESLEEKINNSTALTPEIVSEVFRTIEIHESVFSERGLARAVANHTDNAEVFTRAILEIKNSPELIFLGFGEDGRERFTTKRMFNLENEIQNMADDMRERTHVKISQKHIQNQLESYQKKIGKQLTKEQLTAVEHMLQDSAISCVVGRAGTGKSFSLGAANAVWKSKGIRVFGISLLGVAASNLDKDSGINSRTIDSFRLSVANGYTQLGAGDVVVMDEAGVTDSISMNSVLKTVYEAKAKLVLVGDHAQLQPVGPGACFRALVERIGFREIYTVYRQTGWQAEATVAFSSGDIAKGLEAYQAHGNIHIEQTEREALLRLVNDWVKMQKDHNHSQEDLKRYLVLAYRNEDVHTLNALIRQMRVDKNEISDGYRVSSAFGKIQISKNDRIIFLKNDSTLGVTNGSFATVKNVNFTESGEVINFSVILDINKKEIIVRPSVYQDYYHGYAVTTHKSQSVTFDHTLIYAGGIKSWDRHLTYVSMSRHRKTCDLYADEKTHVNYMELTKALSRSAIKDSVLDFPLAFAARRGIDNPGLSKFLPKLLAEKLSILKERFLEFYKHIISAQFPSLENEKNRENDVSEHQAIYKRREEASLVADYVDAARGSRVLYELSKSKDKSSKEHQLIVEAIESRDLLAFKIIQSVSSYEKAIEVHGLSLDKIKTQAVKHEKREYTKTTRELLNKYLHVRYEFENAGAEKLKHLGEDKELYRHYAEIAKKSADRMGQLAKALSGRTDLEIALKIKSNATRLLNEIRRKSVQYDSGKNNKRGHEKDENQSY